MSGQMKTMLDRANPLYTADYTYRDVYLLATAADEDEHAIGGIYYFILLFQRNIRTAASVKKLEDGLYSMEYKGDYNLDDFLEQGGAPDDLAVTETPVVTNYYLSPGEEYGIGTEESKIRYTMLEDMLQSDSSYSMDGIRDALDSVSKHNFDSEFASTEWSIAYNQSTGEACYYYRENFQQYYSLITGSP